MRLTSSFAILPFPSSHRPCRSAVAHLAASSYLAAGVALFGACGDLTPADTPMAAGGAAGSSGSTATGGSGGNSTAGSGGSSTGGSGGTSTTNTGGSAGSASTDAGPAADATPTIDDGGGSV